MMDSVLKKIEQENTRREVNFRTGDTVRVHVKIKEGDKERVQVFEGVVISSKHDGARAAFTVRKVSYGVGVERVFPLQSPSIDKVEVVTAGSVRRAKLYYLRNLAGKAARLKEREGGMSASAEEGAEAAAEPTPAG